jgi:hypothetical protein
VAESSTERVAVHTALLGQSKTPVMKRCIKKEITGID